MNKGFMYLAAIIDLHTRYVLHWKVSNSMDANWCVKLLQDTLEKHGNTEIFNTDQGSQQTSFAHFKVLKVNGVLISMPQWNWMVKEEQSTTYLLNDYGVR